jgi:predicted small lipoprotein YifL
MKRLFCTLLILLAALSLCGCGQLAPTSEPEEKVPPYAIVIEQTPRETASTAATELPRPGDGLTQEEQMAMWMAFLEKMSENDPTPEEALSKARSRAELLIACGQELLALELPNRDEGWDVTPLTGKWMALYQPLSRCLTDFESENCRLLLDLGIAEDIQIEDNMACFSLGGRGLGSETEYYDVYYIPSDDLTACFGYSEGMVFTEQDGGWLARGTGDNTFFYQQIGEHLYFCIAHF